MPRMADRPQYLVSSAVPLLQQGLAALIERETGGRVVGRARSVAEAAHQARRLRPEAAVIELRAFDGQAAAILRDLHNIAPGIRTIVICLNVNPVVRQLAAEAGVAVLIDTLDTFEQLIPALKRTPHPGQPVIH